jgi:alpha-tubulin suppressor-like RCC1 family protein
VFLPTPLPIPKEFNKEKVNLISAFSNQTMCVLGDGKVLGWGRNHKGGVGAPSSQNDISFPTLVLSLS